MNSVVKRPITRRCFVGGAAATAGMSLLAACAAPQQQPVSTATQAPKPSPSAAPAATTAPAATNQPTVAPAAATKGTGPKRGGTFTLGRTATITNFSPLWLGVGSHGFARALFNTLAKYDMQLKPQPDLAEKWELTPDGKSITLKLREGVKFHSGREFTADDVKFSVEFASTDDRVTLRTLYQTIKKVESNGKYTVTLQFDKLNPGVYDLLDTMYIVDKDTIGDLAKSAVGTGPFKLDKYIPNDRIEFIANKDYWDKGKPYVDKYVLRDIPDVSALSINLESGSIDCAWLLNYLDIARLRDAGPKYVVDPGAPGSIMFCLVPNCKVEPFDDKRVRQAVAWSIDRARFTKTILQGLVEPTNLMWPPHSWAYFKDLEGKVGFDINKAQTLLKEAGLDKGFETEITTSTKRTYGMGQLAQILQADFAKVGIKAKVSDLELAQYEAQNNKREGSLTIITYGRLNRDPGTLVTAAKMWINDKEGGQSRFESAEYDRLRQELQSTLDQSKRQATARKIQEMALDEAFTLPIAPDQRFFVTSNYVKGLSYNMDNAPFVGEIWLDK
ncbi:MAG: ABC transporter substrate-binding protein [Chloroflexota bacterium]